MKEKNKVLAERFLRGVYGGDLSIVNELADNDIVSSYPVFKKLFNTISLHGRKAVEEFATGFNNRWTDSHIIVHEAIEEDNKVMLLWSFRARYVGTGKQDEEGNNQEQSWGGITFFRFNSSDKIVIENGEESEPGPFERMTDNNE